MWRIYAGEVYVCVCVYLPLITRVSYRQYYTRKMYIMCGHCVHADNGCRYTYTPLGTRKIVPVYINQSITPWLWKTVIDCLSAFDRTRIAGQWTANRLVDSRQLQRSFNLVYVSKYLLIQNISGQNISLTAISPDFLPLFIIFWLVRKMSTFPFG